MRRDGGAATVWVACACSVLCVVFAAVLAMGQAVVARHRAGAAADLAALAASDQALRGTSAACGVASRVARAQGAEVVRCTVAGEVSDVTARVRVGPYAPRSRSRAGPAGVTPADGTGPPRPFPSVSRSLPPSGAAGGVRWPELRPAVPRTAAGASERLGAVP